MKKLVSLFLFVFVFFAFACNQNAKFAENLSISQYQSSAISNVFGGKANPNKVDAPEITQDMLSGDSQAISALTGENALLLSSPRPFSISMSKVNWDGNVFCSIIENGKVVDIKWDGSSVSAFNYDDTYFIYLRGENNTTITNGSFYSFLIPTWQSDDESLGKTITFTGDIRNLVNCLDAENVKVYTYILKSFLSYFYYSDDVDILIDESEWWANENDYYGDFFGKEIANVWILWEDSTYYYCLDDFDKQGTLVFDVYKIKKTDLMLNEAEGIFSEIPKLIAPNDGVDGSVPQIVDTLTYSNPVFNNQHYVFRKAKDYYPTGNINDGSILKTLEDKFLLYWQEKSMLFSSDEPFCVSFSKENNPTWDGVIEYVEFNEEGSILNKTWNGEKIEAKLFNGAYYIAFVGHKNKTITKGISKNHFVFEGTKPILAKGNLNDLIESYSYHVDDNVRIETVGGLFFEQNVQYECEKQEILFNFYGPYSEFISYENSTDYLAQFRNTKEEGHSAQTLLIWFDKISDNVEYTARIYNSQNPYGYDILSDNIIRNVSYDDFSTQNTLVDDGKTSSCWIRDESKTKIGLLLAEDDKDSIVDISINYIAGGETKTDKFLFSFLTPEGIVNWHNLSLKNILKKFDEAIEGDWWHVIYADNLKKTITDKGKATIHVRYTAGIRDYDTSAIHVPQRFGYGGGAFKVEQWTDNNITISTNEVFYDVTGNASTSPNKISHIGYKNMGSADVLFPFGIRAVIEYNSPSVYGDNWNRTDNKNYYRVIQDWIGVDAKFPRLIEQYSLQGQHVVLGKASTYLNDCVNPHDVNTLF